MQNLKPKKAAEAPLAAALLGMVLVKSGQEDHDSDQTEHGRSLLQVAMRSEKARTPEFKAAVKKASEAIGKVIPEPSN